MNLRVRDPLSPLSLVETRLGQMHARQRLAIEREHEAKALGRGFTFLHMQNMSIKQMMIEVILRATGTYWWGHANAGKVQLRRNDVRLPRLPQAFDGFTILHLSDLHADMSASALERVAELALGLEYDLCVLTGDYRGAPTAISSRASTASRACGKCCTLTSMRCWEITIPSPWFPPWRRSVFACCSTKASQSSAAPIRFTLPGWTRLA